MSRPSISIASPLLPIVDLVSEAVIVAMPDPWRVVYANPAAKNTFRNLPDEVSDRGDAGPMLAVVLGEKAPPDFIAQLEQFWQSGEPKAALSAGLSIGGRPAVASRVHALRLTVDGRPLLAIVTRFEIETAGDVAPIAAARRDPLTHLPDRTFLLSRLAELMRDDQLAKRRFAVLFVDLDNFKQINDAQGHLVGDRVLHEVAQRLAHCVREGDQVVRFGGDEFVVLVEQVDSPADVDVIIRRIHAVLAKPIATPKGDVSLSVSIGAAEASPVHRSPEELLAAADRAMYAAKRPNG